MSPFWLRFDFSVDEALVSLVSLATIFSAECAEIDDGMAAERQKTASDASNDA